MTFPQKVFVVDIDGVLHRGSLPAKWHKATVEKLCLQDETYRKYCETRRLYRQGKASPQDHTKSFVASWNKVILNVDYTTANKVSTNLISDEGWDNFIFPSNLVRLAKEQGFLTIALSRCPTFILDLYNEIFGFDLLIGASWVSYQGCFTGEVANPKIFENKKSVLIEALEKMDVSIDLSKSFGIGDTGNDAEWLSLLAFKIAFNPDASLLSHAKKSKNSYIIVHECKDVVFCPSYPDIFHPKKLAESLLNRMTHFL